MAVDTSDTGHLELSLAAEEFFQQAVGEAMKRRGISATADSEMYLVSLLATHARQPVLGEVVEPFGVRLAHAMRASGGERFLRLRQLGDDALFISGFYAEHLQHRGLPRDYVSDLGQLAYGGVASILRAHAGRQSGVFDELAQRFVAFVDLLQHVADSLFASSARDEAAVLELYERWSRTGSKVLADALLRLGFAPRGGSPGIN